MTLVVVWNRYRVVAGLPEMAGSTQESVHAHRHVPVHALHEPGQIGRVRGLDQEVNVVAHDREAVQPASKPSHRTADCEEDDRPRFAAAKIEGAIVAANRDVVGMVRTEAAGGSWHAAMVTSAIYFISLLFI